MLLKILFAIALGILSVFTGPAFAHIISPDSVTSHSNPWVMDPVVLVCMILCALVYWRGSRHLGTRHLGVGSANNRKTFMRRRLYFWLGFSTLGLALLSPIDFYGELLFSVHMVQHELIMLVAAPFLVMSRPSSALLHGSPGAISTGLGKFIRFISGRHVRAWIISPAMAWCIHAIGLWAWHLPSLFNASLESNYVHTLQHISFIIIALIFWYAILTPHNTHPAIAVIYLFTTAIHASLLGALLTLSPSVWYHNYIETTSSLGLSPLNDQHLGGIIMWMPSGTVLIIAGLWMMAQLLRDSEAQKDSKN